MKKTFLSAALGALVAFSAFSAAQADERWPRWYVGLTGGYSYMDDADVSGGTSVRSINLDDGYGFGGSIGYLPSSSSPLLNSLRFEAEITHHRSSVDSISTTGAGVAGRGDFSSTAYMVNAFYDMQSSSGWSPYIGGGVGIANLQLSKNSGAGNVVDDSSNEFAYQGLVGIGYSPSSIPNTQWSLGYRYLGTTDAAFDGPGGKIEAEYNTHNFEVGAKFRF